MLKEILQYKFAVSSVERARMGVLLFDNTLSSSAYDDLYRLTQQELLRFRATDMPITVLETGGIRYLSKCESMRVFDYLLAETDKIRQEIATHIWQRENFVRVV